MSLQKEKIRELLQKDELTADERQWLYDHIGNADEDLLKEVMEKLFEADVENPAITDRDESEDRRRKILKRIKKPGIRQKLNLTTISITRLAAAACILVLIGVGIFLKMKSGREQQSSIPAEIATSKSMNDVQPGGNKAVLQLGDGSSIVLDTTSNGTIMRQGNTNIVKTDGIVNYKVSAGNKNEVLFNIISTPRGGQYQVVLPDGSKVWLNASSSIRFPTAFTGTARRVDITGEAYFEVARNKSMPFIVNAKGSEIEVLGTHFNVMAYEDEDYLRTTLLEGAVKFTNHGSSATLKPGQQSRLNDNGQMNVLDDVDLEDVMAWKNGYFHFNGADFQATARQLSRWYDVDVICNKKVDDLLYADIPRNTKLSDVLTALELTGKIRFEITGNKVIVIP